MTHREMCKWRTSDTEDTDTMAETSVDRVRSLYEQYLASSNIISDIDIEEVSSKRSRHTNVDEVFQQTIILYILCIIIV